MSRKGRALKTARPFREPVRERNAPRYIAQPRLFVTLNPTSLELMIELPGPSGRRLVAVHELETIRRELMDQLDCAENMRPSTIGMDSEPTEAQVKHWEEHSKRSLSTKLHSNCPFCITEAKHPVNRFDKHGKPIIPGVGDPDLLGL